MKDSFKKKVILWSDRCSSQFRSKYVLASVTHFDQLVQLEWHYNEAHHGKGFMDGVGGTVKGVDFGFYTFRLHASYHHTLIFFLYEKFFLTQMEFVFQNFIDHQTILNLFVFNIIFEQTLVCAITVPQQLGGEGVGQGDPNNFQDFLF